MKDKYLKTPEHIRQVLAEAVNVLRKKENITRTEIEKHRTIGYLAQIILQAIREGEIEKRLTALEEKEK